MNVCDLIADMVRAGVDPELIGRTAQLLCEREAVIVQKKSAGAERQARYRERNKASQVTESDAVSKSTPLDKEIPPTPPKEINPPYNPPNQKTREASEIRENLQSVLSSDTAQAVIDHRKKLKKPMTPLAAKLLAGKFAKCRDGPEAAANAMIANGWQGFDPEWMNRNDQRNRSSGKPNAPGVVAYLRELHDQPGDDLPDGTEPIPDQRRQIIG